MITEQLKKLKEDGEGYVKEYNDQPRNFIQYGDWVFTYVIEKVIIKGTQATLTVSNIDGQEFKVSDIPEDFQKAIKDVFGEFFICLPAYYPKRGHSLQFIKS